MTLESACALMALDGPRERAIAELADLRRKAAVFDSIFGDDAKDQTLLGITAGELRRLHEAAAGKGAT